VAAFEEDRDRERSFMGQCYQVMNSSTGMRTMFKSALLGIGFVAAVATAAIAQPYYSYYYPSYSYYPGYSYPTYSYPYGYASYYGWPNQLNYYRPPYRAAPAYSDPSAWWRPYSDGAGPKASGHTGY
jgi:hypothetical protein